MRFERPAEPIRSRIAVAAAHVVADAAGGIDYEATLAQRRWLWSWGLGVAEAMDTAQRGMGLDWPRALELIRLSAAEARESGGLLLAGAQTDQLEPGSARDLEEVVDAYREQCEAIEATGAGVVVMASRELARLAQTADDYRRVYAEVLARLERPAVIHWLGPAFDPALAGYWGDADVRRAARTCLKVVEDSAAKVSGIKLSLLDAKLEVELRRRLPPGVRLFTGDDNRFVELIAGDGRRHSDALLGILDAIAPAASTALQALDRGDVSVYRELLEPAERLSRVIFEPPTHDYKAGLAFLAWVNGRQPGFHLLGGLERARSREHLGRVFEAALAAGLIEDPELGRYRLRSLPG